MYSSIHVFYVWYMLGPLISFKKLKFYYDWIHSVLSMITSQLLIVQLLPMMAYFVTLNSKKLNLTTCLNP